MKQSGFRLVQRKFAQGVPIPVNPSPAAPPPPERRTDPPCPPRSVYHNNMSARSLLDVVALQNLHRHKQQEPLVILKRLRDDEIHSAFSSPPKAPARKRRALKADKNQMALRSGKRKAPEAPKLTIRRRKKNSSESTDDLPLAFYDGGKKRKEAQANKIKLAKRETRSRAVELADKRTQHGQNARAEERKKSLDLRTRAATKLRQERNAATLRRPSMFTSRLDSTDRSEDGSFTFKEPKNPVRLSYRGYKEKRAAAAAAKGRPPLKISFRPASEVRSSPRSSVTQRSLSEEPIVAKRLRNKLVPAEKSQPPAVPETTVPPPFTPPPPVEEPLPSLEPSTSNAAIPTGWTDISTRFDTPRCSLDSMQSADTLVLDTEFTTFHMDMSTPTTEVLNELEALDTKSSSEDWCIQECAEKDADNLSVKSETIELTLTLADVTPIPPSVSESVQNDAQENPEIVSPPQQAIESTTGNTTPDSEPETLNIVKQKINMEKRNEKAAKQKNKKSAEPREEVVEKRRRRNCKLKQKQVGKKNQQKKNARQTSAKQARKSKQGNKSRIITRGAWTNNRETITRILRNSSESPQVPANPSPANPSPDVYEFDAEREASGPPSGLRARRNQPTPTEPAQPAQPTGRRELLAYFTSQKSPKRDPTNTPSTSRDAISDETKKALIENLQSSSPSLLDKFLDCLSPEIQSELENLIAAEQASGDNKMDVKNEYLDPKTGSLTEALTFHPTAEEFADPILYIEKIAPRASAHGLCKIVPPAGFKPPCNMSDTIRFAVIYQYISKMYSRWGPITRELAAIKAHLRTQSVMFARSPLLDGSELNLPKLYHVVERHGGLNNVMQRKRWGRVADEMKLTKLQHPERKLDPIYMRYLLPYATLSDQERQTIMSEVEKYWTLKYQKMLKRARNPFQRQARMLSAETENESSDDERDDTGTAGALREAEDCIVPGRSMNIATFKKIATALMDAHFEPKSQPPSPIEVEKAYWKAVLLGTEHIVANTASIDTGEEGYGFPKDPEAEYGAHPWNLKVLARNPNNVLRYLGQVLGVTVPTLHLHMLFSTSCWHRDPHGLPWIEYMHSGAEKIWYGIPRDESSNFRRAVETLCPAYCQNKSIWLASEITMIPPNVLSEHEVRLSRLVQRPGEYVLVFPEAHSCSITTGFGISESVYFASNTWLSEVYKLFQELRNSCEPTMFSLEQLLLNGSKDDLAPPQISTVLATLLGAELELRRALEEKGLAVQERPPSDAPLNTSYFRAWHTRDYGDECEYCRCTLYLSKVIGLTGRNSAVCPEHAIRLIETKKNKNVDVSTLEFVSSYSTSTIEEMVERLESRSGEQVPVIDLTAPTPVPVVEPQPGPSRLASFR